MSGNYGTCTFGSYAEAPEVVARVRLSDLARDGTLALYSSDYKESHLVSAVIDPVAGFAYFGTEYGRVIKVRLSDLTRASAMDVGPTLTAVIDPAASFAYFGAGGAVARLDLTAGGAATATVTGGGVSCPSSATKAIQVYLTGTPPWSLVWSDGATQTGLLTSPASRDVAPAVMTTYTVTSVSDVMGAGTASGGATFTIKPAPPAPTISAPAAALPGATGLTASVPFHVGSEYEWSVFGGRKTSPDSTTSNSITFTAAVTGSTRIWAFEKSGGCWSPVGKATVAVATPLSLYTLPPCRVLDTRTSSGPALAAGSDRIFDTTGQCAIPSTATALSVNVAVTEPAASGNLSLHAGNEPVSPTATINFSTGQTRANNAIVRLASDGSGTLGVQNNSAGTVQFILDVNGYFQ